MNGAIGQWNPIPQAQPSGPRSSQDNGPGMRSGQNEANGPGQGFGLNEALGQNRGADRLEKSDQTAGKNFDVDGLVSNLWSFMQGRLEQAQVSGASDAEMDKLWQAAEKGLKQGFGQAREALQAMNRMNPGLNEKIDTAYEGLTAILDARDLTASAPVTEQADEAPATADNRRISLYQYQEQSFALNLKTTEGDRITIQVRNSQESGADYQRNQNSEALYWGRADNNAFQLEIQGDLNETERADLNALLKEVNELADEFYDGNMDLAWGKAQALNINGSSLASMDLRMRDVETKGVAAYQAAGGEQQLPRGLESLRQYARDMVSAQQKWMDSFNSRDALPQSIKNHPLNDGRLEAFTRSLLGGN